MGQFTEPEEVLNYVYDVLNNNKVALGLAYVGYADEPMLFEYPAAVVSFNVPVDRTLGPTGTFNLHWQVGIVVYHAKLDVDHKTRTREDMQLASAIRNKLHEDYHAIRSGVASVVGMAFVVSERPGIIADDRGQANVATSLVWTADSRASINP